MNIEETVQALGNILLRGQVCPTGHEDYTRVFALDVRNVTLGRLTIFKGQYSHAKWYVEGVMSGPVIPDERIVHAWRLWLERREPLTEERWDAVVHRATTLARAERAEKQAWRDANPLPSGKRRQRLELPVRKHIMAQLYPELFASAPVRDLA